MGMGKGTRASQSCEHLRRRARPGVGSESTTQETRAVADARFEEGGKAVENSKWLQAGWMETLWWGGGAHSCRGSRRSQGRRRRMRLGDDVGYVSYSSGTGCTRRQTQQHVDEHTEVYQRDRHRNEDTASVVGDSHLRPYCGTEHPLKENSPDKSSAGPPLGRHTHATCHVPRRRRSRCVT